MQHWKHGFATQDGRIVSVAVILAVGVNTDGRREVLGMDVGPSEAETFWTAFLRKLARRGLRGVKLVISDAHEGIKASVAKVMNAAWQSWRLMAHEYHQERGSTQAVEAEDALIPRGHAHVLLTLRPLRSKHERKNLSSARILCPAAS